MVNAALVVCIAVLTNLVLEHKYLLATFPMLTLTDMANRHTCRGRCMTQLMLTLTTSLVSYTFPCMCV